MDGGDGAGRVAASAAATAAATVVSWPPPGRLRRAAAPSLPQDAPGDDGCGGEAVSAPTTWLVRAEPGALRALGPARADARWVAACHGLAMDERAEERADAEAAALLEADELAPPVGADVEEAEAWRAARGDGPGEREERGALLDEHLRPALDAMAEALSDRRATLGRRPGQGGGEALALATVRAWERTAAAAGAARAVSLARRGEPWTPPPGLARAMAVPTGAAD